MTQKIGKMEDLWGISSFFSYMRKMSSVNNRMALGIPDSKLVYSSLPCVLISAVQSAVGTGAPPQMGELENFKDYQVIKIGKKGVGCFKKYNTR